MTRIVRTAYRYKRPPGKRKPVALGVPAADPAKAHRLPVPAPALPGVVSTSIKRAALPAAHDDPQAGHRHRTEAAGGEPAAGPAARHAGGAPATR
jgi:hypothetical protein